MKFVSPVFVVALVLYLSSCSKNINIINLSDYLKKVKFCNAVKPDELNATVYFADSYASWQKGAIENTNKLIRQYIPKGTDFDLLTDEFIHSVQLKINRRPREKLNFSTPKDEFFKFLSQRCTCLLTLPTVTNT